ncbi:MAG: Gfo/Idh/MocA family protein [Anaerolineae bacterium]
MKHKTLGIAIVGAGMMGRYHAQAWASVPEAQLVALADSDPLRAQALASNLGLANWSTDYRQAVDRGDVDIVSVCVPAYYHPEVSLFAAEHGKDVLCEKPIALTIERALAMIEAAKRSNVLLGIGFQLRQLQSTQQLCRLLQEGSIGRPAMWVYSFAAPIRAKVAMHDMLTGNGGPVVDFCPHRFDLWSLAFASEATLVQAQGLTLAQGRPELARIERLAPDTAALSVRYASGDIGALTITWGLPPGVNGNSLAEIWGPKGLIQADLDKLCLLTEGGEEATFGPYGQDVMVDAMRLQAQAFASAVIAGEKPPVTGEDGLAALRVSLAALRSMETGLPINPKELS